MAIEVVKAGLATSVQDAGRPGYYHLGIPLSGALDPLAFRLANLLVGNAEGAAALECALLAPELRFTQAAVVAVTGAVTTLRLNATEVPRNTAFRVRQGDTLKFGFMMLGARSYVAVAGGIDVPVVLGSRSTYGLGAFGGFKGRKLEPGDVLPIGVDNSRAREGTTAPAGWIREPEKEVRLRVLPGLYDHRLTTEAAQSFYADTWSVAPEADRIGYRYRHGKPLAFRERTPPFGAGSDPSNIVDAGYPYGSIQVPGGLEPIILQRDAVSGGGYAMIGTVISADMGLIAQMQPNYKARFVAVNMEEALQARAHETKRLQQLRAALVA